MSGLRARVTAFVAVSGTLLLGSCDGDRVARARALDASIAASEAMMLSFRDSVRGVSEEEKARRAQAVLAVRAPDNLEACSSQLPAEQVTRHTTDVFTLELPADFTLTRDGDVDRKKNHYGYGRYEFKGSDGSTVIIDAANRYDAHTGWTGSVSSECDLSIGPHNAHLDVANATIQFEDRIVHAHIDMGPQLALMFVGHARSRPRQAELLSAVHTIRVKPAWGETN